MTYCPQDLFLVKNVQGEVLTQHSIVYFHQNFSLDWVFTTLVSFLAPITCHERKETPHMHYVVELTSLMNETVFIKYGCGTSW
jgi:hypothetical protein